MTNEVSRVGFVDKSYPIRSLSRPNVDFFYGPWKVSENDIKIDTGIIIVNGDAVKHKIYESYINVADIKVQPGTTCVIDATDISPINSYIDCWYFDEYNRESNVFVAKQSVSTSTSGGNGSSTPVTALNLFGITGGIIDLIYSKKDDNKIVDGAYFKLMALAEIYIANASEGLSFIGGLETLITVELTTAKGGAISDIKPKWSITNNNKRIHLEYELTSGNLSLDVTSFGEFFYATITLTLGNYTAVFILRFNLSLRDYGFLISAAPGVLSISALKQITPVIFDVDYYDSVANEKVAIETKDNVTLKFYFRDENGIEYELLNDPNNASTLFKVDDDTRVLPTEGYFPGKVSKGNDDYKELKNILQYLKFGTLIVAKVIVNGVVVKSEYINVVVLSELKSLTNDDYIVEYESNRDKLLTKPVTNDSTKLKAHTAQNFTVRYNGQLCDFKITNVNISGVGEYEFYLTNGLKSSSKITKEISYSYKNDDLFTGYYFTKLSSDCIVSIDLEIQRVLDDKTSSSPVSKKIVDSFLIVEVGAVSWRLNTYPETIYYTVSGDSISYPNGSYGYFEIIKNDGEKSTVYSTVEELNTIKDLVTLNCNSINFSTDTLTNGNSDGNLLKCDLSQLITPTSKDNLLKFSLKTTYEGQAINWGTDVFLFVKATASDYYTVTTNNPIVIVDNDSTLSAISEAARTILTVKDNKGNPSENYRIKTYITGGSLKLSLASSIYTYNASNSDSNRKFISWPSDIKDSDTKGIYTFGKNDNLNDFKINTKGTLIIQIDVHDISDKFLGWTTQTIQVADTGDGDIYRLDLTYDTVYRYKTSSKGSWELVDASGGRLYPKLTLFDILLNLYKGSVKLTIPDPSFYKIEYKYANAPDVNAPKVNGVTRPEDGWAKLQYSCLSVGTSGGSINDDYEFRIKSVSNDLLLAYNRYTWNTFFGLPFSYNLITKTRYYAGDKPENTNNSDWKGTVDDWTGKVWMRQGFVIDNNATPSSWSDPILIADNGQIGTDNEKTEYAYHLARSMNAPEKPSSSSTKINDSYHDGYPTDSSQLKWTDHPTGISPTFKYEYISVRNTDDTNWSPPVLWSAFGLDGKDGDGIEYLFRPRLTPLTDEQLSIYKEKINAYLNDKTPEINIDYVNKQLPRGCYLLEENDGIYERWFYDDSDRRTWVGLTSTYSYVYVATLKEKTKDGKRRFTECMDLRLWSLDLSKLDITQELLLDNDVVIIGSNATDDIIQQVSKTNVSYNNSIINKSGLTVTLGNKLKPYFDYTISVGTYLLKKKNPSAELPKINDTITVLYDSHTKVLQVSVYKIPATYRLEVIPNIIVSDKINNDTTITYRVLKNGTYLPDKGETTTMFTFNTAVNGLVVAPFKDTANLGNADTGQGSLTCGDKLTNAMIDGLMAGGFGNDGKDKAGTSFGDMLKKHKYIILKTYYNDYSKSYYKLNPGLYTDVPPSTPSTISPYTINYGTLEKNKCYVGPTSDCIYSAPIDDKQYHLFTAYVNDGKYPDAVASIVSLVYDNDNKTPLNIYEVQDYVRTMSQVVITSSGQYSYNTIYNGSKVKLVFIKVSDDKTLSISNEPQYLQKTKVIPTRTLVDTETIGVVANGAAGETGVVLVNTGSWVAKRDYRCATPDGTGQRYTDIVYYNGGWYKCIEQHNSGTSFDVSNWEQGESYGFLLTDAMMANSALVGTLTSGKLYVNDGNDNYGGMIGPSAKEYQGGDPVILWAGGNQNSAPFRVTKSGNVISKGVSLPEYRILTKDNIVSYSDTDSATNSPYEDYQRVLDIEKSGLFLGIFNSEFQNKFYEIYIDLPACNLNNWESIIEKGIANTENNNLVMSYLLWCLSHVGKTCVLLVDYCQNNCVGSRDSRKNAIEVLLRGVSGHNASFNYVDKICAFESNANAHDVYMIVLECIMVKSNGKTEICWEVQSTLKLGERTTLSTIETTVTSPKYINFGKVFI